MQWGDSAFGPWSLVSGPWAAQDRGTRRTFLWIVHSGEAGDLRGGAFVIRDTVCGGTAADQAVRPTSRQLVFIHNR